MLNWKDHVSEWTTVGKLEDGDTFFTEEGRLYMTSQRLEHAGAQVERLCFEPTTGKALTLPRDSRVGKTHGRVIFGKDRARVDEVLAEVYRAMDEMGKEYPGVPGDACEW